MLDTGRWIFLTVVPFLFGCFMFVPIYAARPSLVGNPRYEQKYALAGAVLLLVTMLATAAGFITGTLLADADRVSWARMGLSACAVPIDSAEEVASASGTPVLIAENTWASFFPKPYSGRVSTYGTGPLAGQACDSGDVGGD